MTQEQGEKVNAASSSINQRHVQTLVGMNHCVGTARRDAIYKCLVDYCQLSGEEFHAESPQRRQQAYRHCQQLLNEAMMSAGRATLSYERQGILDRPSFHILKMLSEIIGTMIALAAYVQMVQEEADVLKEPLGENTYECLTRTSSTFEANERMARESFFNMLEVGITIMDSSTKMHRGEFSEEEERRYQTAFLAFVERYSQADCRFPSHLLQADLMV